MIIHFVIHVYKGKRERREMDVSLSSKILIFFKKTTKRKKNCVSFVCPNFFQIKKAPSTHHHSKREREKERERKTAQNRRLFASSFFLKESFNNT